MVMYWFALLPHSKKVLGSISGSTKGALFVWSSVHVLHGHAWVLRFPLTVQKHAD